MTQEFDRDKFAGVIGSVFILKAGGGVSAELELLEVTELLERQGLRGFSILFRAPEDYQIQQGLYDLEHASLGTMQLFLVPVGRKNNRLRLEGIFNWMIADASGSDD